MPDFDAILGSRSDGRFWGKYEAIIGDINDPEKRGRIRVKNNFFYGSSLSPWAKACLPYAGSMDIGDFPSLEVGMGVWIEFQYGLLNYPIWTGFWVARPKGISELPAEVKQNPAIKITKTKKYLIMIDDSADLIKIKRKDSDDTITIKSGIIELGEGANKSVVFGEDLITWLNSHTHQYESGSITTQTPTSQITNTVLSNKVKVK